MGLSKIEIRFNSVLKDMKDHPDGPNRYANEVRAYTEIPWACPALLCHNEWWIETERCTPIINLGTDLSRKYRDPLKELIQRVHDAGFWHCDIDLVNVVIHPTRGPLLIDWENLREASSPVSYDLYGARVSGVEPSWPDKGPDGVWWGCESVTSPKSFWEE